MPIIAMIIRLVIIYVAAHFISQAIIRHWTIRLEKKTATTEKPQAYYSNRR